MKNPDIDIDFASREDAIASLSHCVRARRGDDDIPHPSGIYLQNAPVNPFTGLCSVDYKQADELGYFKIDFLNQSVYNQVRDEQHLDELLSAEPLWELLDERAFVEQLPHISNYYSLIQEMKPVSIDDLSIILALIRPGKKHLIGKSRADIEKEIWDATNDEYFFKKSHAISYAALVVVKMNLILEELSK